MCSSPQATRLKAFLGNDRELMRHRVNHIVDAEPVAQHRIKLGIARVGGMLPTVAEIDIKIDQNHQTMVVVKNAAAMRVAAVVLESRALIEGGHAGHLRIMIEVKITMKDGMLRLQFDRRA